MSGTSTPALLLRQADRGDDDRWVSLLSPGGRIPALARHARGSKRRFGAALQPFVLIEAALRQRGGGLSFLESALALEHPLGPEPSLEQMSAGWLFLELAEQFCQQGQAQPAFFELVLGGLRRIGKGAEPLGAVRLSVLWGALDLEGWAPNLDVCARCGSPAPWASVALDADAGGLLCPRCHAGPGCAPAVLDAWRAAAEGRPAQDPPPAAETELLRWAEHQTGKPLRSTHFAPFPIGA